MADGAVSWPAHTLGLVYDYLLYGEHRLSETETELREEARRQPGGKFSKRDVSYLPFRPFPLLLWDNTCGRCRFWHDGGPSEPGHCQIVGREDDPYGGEAIHEHAWCGLYTPPAGEPAFAWIRERVKPSGATDVRGTYDPPLTEKARLRRRKRRLGRRDATARTEQSSESHGPPSARGGASRGDGDE